MWKTILLMFAVTIIGTGCSITPLLNPPVEDKKLDAATNKALIGKWKADSNNTIYEGEVTWALDEKGKPMDRLQIVATAKRDAKSKPLASMMGGAFNIDNEIYIVLCADITKLFPEDKNAEESVFMVRPNFFVAKLTPDGANFNFQWIDFFEKTTNTAGENIDTPIDPLAKKENNLMINSTNELQKLLKEKKYKLQSPILMQKQ